ncbi:MAG: hypothetical protein ACYTHJ_00405 [Planctomycetota bacterium]|jgi:predicted RNA-binding Zn-ribbon protein involved in translation (DUF1610 family)
MSWIWPDYFHHDLRLTKQERKEIHRDAWRLWWSRKSNIALYAMLPIFYLLTVFFAGDVGGRVATLIGAGGLIHRLFRAGAPIALFVFCFILGGAALQRLRFAPCVFRATRQHGYDVCIKCGYWLKGLDASIKRCPECGIAREEVSKSDTDGGNDGAVAR